MTRVNGEIMQDSNTDDLIFDVPTLVHELSKVMTLDPGDVIITGTPSGVAMARKPQNWLKPGDVCEVEIEKIGVLRNPIAQGRPRSLGTTCSARCSKEHLAETVLALTAVGTRCSPPSMSRVANSVGAGGVDRIARHHDHRDLEGDAGQRRPRGRRRRRWAARRCAMAARMSSFSASASARTSGLSSSVRMAVKFLRASASSSGSSTMKSK